MYEVKTLNFSEPTVNFDHFIHERENDETFKGDPRIKLKHKLLLIMREKEGREEGERRR